MINLNLPKEPFRLIAFDPGSTSLGCCLLKKDLDKETIEVDTVYTVTLRDTHLNYKALKDYHSSKVIRLLILRDTVAEFINEHKPHAVIVEGNYLGRFAASFAALVECVAIIRSVLYDYNKFLPLYLVDPTTVKKDIGMVRIKGTDKEDVRKALMALEDIDWGIINPDELDEHSIDSVAVGYHYFTKLL